MGVRKKRQRKVDEKSKGKTQLNDEPAADYSKLIDPNVFDVNSTDLIVDRKKKIKKEDREKLNQLKKKGKEPIGQRKPLTKKERRRLEKIVDEKAKKRRRSDILESLEEIHAKRRRQGDFAGFTVVDVTNAKCSRRKKISTVKRTKKPIKFEENEDEEEEEEDNDDDDQEELNSPTETETDNDEEISSQFYREIIANDVGTDKREASSSEDEDEEKTKRKTSSFFKSSKPVPANLITSTYIPVERDPAIQEQRKALPIFSEEHEVIDLVRNHPIVIICGETGSGKTTQVPQFLYEVGFAENGQIIGVTEPRRVAAISMSERVGTEMNFGADRVSYQIRYEGNSGAETKILFMTDGVLLKEVERDFLLNRYRVVVIDEAHERSVNTDILIGLLSRIVPLRWKKGRPLSLVIMSATLRVRDFTENQRLFPSGSPPVLNVKSRQFPVSVHFSRRTKSDYVKEALRKTLKIHRTLPSGGILVFVTGQKEVETLVKCLRRFSSTIKDKTVSRKERKPVKKVEVNLDECPILPSSTPSVNVTQPAENCVKKEKEEEEEEEPSPKKLHVLPLYSLLPANKQQLVFRGAPKNKRLCVITTNVAETSLTIPGIRYVIDTGKEKQRVYDTVTGVSCFTISWISQASASQRAGRAGRLGPGHCYRLYSSAVFGNDFPPFSQPEICRKPALDVVLLMKAMYIDAVQNFPFPTPPDAEALAAAEKLLVSLGALNRVALKGPTPAEGRKISGLGKIMADLPIGARFSRCLAVVCSSFQPDSLKLPPQFDELSFEIGLLSKEERLALLQYLIYIVSALSVNQLLLHSGASPENDKEEDTKEEDSTVNSNWSEMRKSCIQPVGSQSWLLGDLSVLMRIVGASNMEETKSLCSTYGVRAKALDECRKLGRQLCNEVNELFPLINFSLDNNLAPPSEKLSEVLRKVVLASCPDLVKLSWKKKRDKKKTFLVLPLTKLLPVVFPTISVAKLIIPHDETVANSQLTIDERTGVVRSSKTTGSVKRRPYYQLVSVDGKEMYIHGSSVLFSGRSTSNLPEFVICQEVLEERERCCLRTLTVVEQEWLPVLCPAYTSFPSPKPLEKPPPEWDNSRGIVRCHMNSTYGPHFWPIPAVSIPYPSCLDAYRWFAVFLLNGEIFPRLQSYTKRLLSSPNIMLKSWARLQSRTEHLLQSLVSRQIFCRHSLELIWSASTDDANSGGDSDGTTSRSDKMFLLEEYLMWLPSELHAEVRLLWPPTETE